MTKFGWIAQIRSRQDKESPKMCLDSLTNCYYLSWEITPSILESPCVIMSILYQRLDFPLKPPRRTVGKRLFTINKLRFNSKLLINDLKSSWHWLSERYNLMKLHSLPFCFTNHTFLNSSGHQKFFVCTLVVKKYWWTRLLVKTQ